MSEMGRVPALNKEKRKRRGSRVFFILGWLFFIGLSAVMFFRSPLSKVDSIEVVGNHLLDEEDVSGLSQIEQGNSFFTIKTKEIEQVLLSLPEVKEANVTRHFPGKVTIELEEYRTVSYLMQESDKIIPILENGTRLENYSQDDRVIDKPILRQWTDFTLLPKFAEEMMKLEPTVMNAISEIEQEQGEDPQRLVLYMKDGYEVHTSIRNFAKNMSWYPSFVANLKLEGKDEGIIMLLDGKWFIPYEKPVDKEEGTADENS